MNNGDYVLATKYDDGDPHDHFVVGFYAGETWHSRHHIVDENGTLFRHNGFRRVKKISPARGTWLVSMFPLIEQGCKSVWWWSRQPMNKEYK